MNNSNRSDFNDEAEDSLIAAIDLGSNSFHMVVARWQHGEIRLVERLSEKVQLGFGLDKFLNINTDTQTRALECLERFAQRLQGISPELFRIVGTNTLRVASDSRTFVQKMQSVLSHPIDIISAYEEARLIYLGVAHTLADDKGQRMVIDIGGGSTELILGERFVIQALESLQMGCVSYAKRFFANGKISKRNFQKAVNAARRELLGIQERYRQLGWHSCVGSSGSIRTIAEIIREYGWSEYVIDQSGLTHLQTELLKVKQYDNLAIKGLPDDRKNTIHAAVAILQAIFQAFEIDHMLISDGALREGVLYEMVGRLQHEDVRERTIIALMKRYHVDEAQTARVENTVLKMFDQVSSDWQFNKMPYRDYLRWAVSLHEIGIAISHRRHNYHGAYLIEHSDLAGFANHEQLILATLVKFHRRKIELVEFDQFGEVANIIVRLCILLRIAVLIHHVRIDEELPELVVVVEKNMLVIHIAKDWLTERPLTCADLMEEAQFLKKIGYRLLLK